MSLYCAKLRILLRHKELQWEELPPPGGYGSEEYKQLVPAGNLPALEHSGFLLSDSEAIAEYLNEVFPEPQMLPSDPLERAKIRERSRFHDTRLEPALRALFAYIGSKGRDVVSEKWQLVGERLEQMERLLPDKVDHLTLADCGTPISCAWIDCLSIHFQMDLVLSDRMKSYLTGLSQHAAVARELGEYQPRLANWLASQ